MMQLLWIKFMTSTRLKEESLRISDAPKIDNFWGLPEPQIPKPIGDIKRMNIQTRIYEQNSLRSI